MRCKIAGLGMGLIGVAMLLAGCGQDQKLQETQQQLTTATNELAAARAETSEVKTQLQAKVDELQQNVSKLTEEKADTEKQLDSVKTDLEQKLQQQQAKADALEQDKTNMTSELKVLSDQLDQVNQRLADLQKTHATTVAHLQAMREEYVTLTNQKAALEAKLNDLGALKAQITVVKQEMHVKKVEELKRLDRAEFAMGNHGYMLKEGSWTTVTQAPGSYPLSQELYRQQ
jgi:chromosome segregation ATPase